MALNPFFLQGSQSEQRLVQDLINEQLQIYGVEVTYIPRKFVRKQTIIKEVQSSAFDDNFLLEAYVNTYEGYGGQGDIMTKFGVSLRDELTLTISKERFEDFISPFLESDEDYELSTRPREGDIIFFPLGARLFEVKFVEHEKPFYQLGKGYVWECQCELFEYSDEDLDTGIAEIDAIEAAFANAITVNFATGGSGDFTVGEIVAGGTSNVTAEVKAWDSTTRQLQVFNRSGVFTIPETVTGQTSSAAWTSASYNTLNNVNTANSIDQNADFETLDNDIIDFTETNPFGSIGSTTDTTI